MNVRADLGEWERGVGALGRNRRVRQPSALLLLCRGHILHIPRVFPRARVLERVVALDCLLHTPSAFFARGIASGVKLEELADEGVLHVHLAHVELFVLVRSLRKELAVQVVLLVLGADAVLASKIPRISKLLQPCSLTSFFL
jgi:hypothetical protein